MSSLSTTPGGNPPGARNWRGFSEDSQHGCAKPGVLGDIFRRQGSGEGRQRSQTAPLRDAEPRSSGGTLTAAAGHDEYRLAAASVQLYMGNATGRQRKPAAVRDGLGGYFAFDDRSFRSGACGNHRGDTLRGRSDRLDDPEAEHLVGDTERVRE
jgi:hypothetical protein